MSREVETWARKQRTGDPVTKAVLVAVANWANPFGEECFPSIKRLAEDVEVSERTVQRHIIRLEEMALLQRVERVRKDGSRSSNGFVFPGYEPPRVSHRTPAPPVNLSPPGDNLTPPPDTDVTGPRQDDTRGGDTGDTPYKPDFLPLPPAVANAPADPLAGGAAAVGDQPVSKKERKRGERLPDDWTPPPVESLSAAVQRVVAQWPDGAYAFVAAGFVAHWTAESGYRASKLDWKAAWTKWLCGESARILAAARAGIDFQAELRNVQICRRADPLGAALEARQGEECAVGGAIRKALREQCGERTYDGWLRATLIVVGRNPPVVTMLTQSAFMRDWIATHFTERIQSIAAGRLSGPMPRVLVKVGEA